MKREIVLTAVLASLISAVLTRIALPSLGVAATPSEIVRAQRLEIIDAKGEARMLMTVETDGTAKLSFRGSHQTALSEITQTASGETILQFAGVGRVPSVFLGSGLIVGGPRLVLRGASSPNQKILLGFKSDDVPTNVSDVWGLFFPSDVSSGEYVGMGAARIPGTDEFHGFLLPVK